MSKKRSAVPSIEVREAMLTLAGFKRVDQLCPECETRLWVADIQEHEFSLWFNMPVTVDTDHWCCAQCGYEKMVITHKAE